MIQKIKIFGERNSGTNFLQSLIKQNIKDIQILSTFYKGGSGWKHGYPKPDLFKDTKNILFIFIIRDLEPWLKSMYNNCYSFERPKTIEEFIMNPLTINDTRLDHDVYINKQEMQPIMELRYSKIKNYLQFSNSIDNFIIINLEDLQIDKGMKFLNFLKEIFRCNVSNKISFIDKHQKDKKKSKIENMTLYYQVN
jgi:hypothetical protein